MLWVTVICKYFHRRNAKTGEVNGVDYSDTKSETDLKPEFAKVIPISTLKPNRYKGMSLYEAMCTLMPTLKMLLEAFLVIQLTSVQI